MFAPDSRVRIHRFSPPPAPFPPLCSPAKPRAARPGIFNSVCQSKPLCSRIRGAQRLSLNIQGDPGTVTEPETRHHSLSSPVLIQVVDLESMQTPPHFPPSLFYSVAFYFILLHFQKKKKSLIFPPLRLGR